MKGPAGCSVKAPEAGPRPGPLDAMIPVLPSLQTAALLPGFGAQFSLFHFSQRRTSGSGLQQWQQMGPPGASRKAPSVLFFDPKASSLCPEGRGRRPAVWGAQGCCWWRGSAHKDAFIHPAGRRLWPSGGAWRSGRILVTCVWACC